MWSYGQGRDRRDVSLDGYIAGPNETGLDLLFAWFAGGDNVFQTSNPKVRFALAEPDHRSLQEFADRVGVFVVGRRHRRASSRDRAGTGDRQGSGRQRDGREDREPVPGLGIDTYSEEANGTWWQEAGPTVWAPFPTDTDYFGRREQSWMINLRVRDLDAMLAQLRANGATIPEEVQELAGLGRFGWVEDPEGNRVELWQPEPEALDEPE